MNQKEQQFVTAQVMDVKDEGEGSTYKSGLGRELLNEITDIQLENENIKKDTPHDI
jgi:hypothetical protein